MADFDDFGRGAVPSLAWGRLLPRELSPAVLEGEVSSWFARERITRPGAWRLDRILRSALPPTTTRSCRAWPTASMLVRGSVWTRCSPTTARAPRLRNSRPIPAGSGILFRVAEAAGWMSKGVVREVIFPAAGQGMLEVLAREACIVGTP